MEERSEYASEDRFREVRIVDVYVSNLRLVVETKHHTSFLSVCVRVVEEAVTCCFGTYVYVSVSLFVLAFQRTKHEIYHPDVDFALEKLHHQEQESWK